MRSLGVLEFTVHALLPVAIALVGGACLSWTWDRLRNGKPYRLRERPRNTRWHYLYSLLRDHPVPMELKASLALPVATAVGTLALLAYTLTSSHHAWVVMDTLALLALPLGPFAVALTGQEARRALWMHAHALEKTMARREIEQRLANEQGWELARRTAHVPACASPTAPARRL